MLRSVLLVMVLLTTACSTAGLFAIPQGTTLKINGRIADPTVRPGLFRTHAFSWGASGGAPYQLLDASGNVVREGKLRTHFRVGSLFFPPFAFLVVPIGLRRDMRYDLTIPADGRAVIDAVKAPSAASGTLVAE